MYELLSISSLNLRYGLKGKMLAEPIDFRCACGCKQSLGDSTFAMVRIQYRLNGETKRVVLCGKCIDLLADSLRLGPIVMNSIGNWKLRSRVARVSLVNNDIMCLKCSSKSQTHIFMKFDNMYNAEAYGRNVHERIKSYGTVKVCAQCVISYLQSMLGQKKRLCRKKFKYNNAGKTVVV